MGMCRCLPVVGIGWILLFSLGFAPTRVSAAIAGSKHDFRGLGWSGNEICRPCHVPHNAYPFNAPPGVPVTGEVPLWNHETTAATYTLYSSPTGTLDQVPGTPGPMSLACLSCHDGTVALDSYGGASGNNYISGPTDIGTNLANDHPVGILWSHQTLANPSTYCGKCHLVHPMTFLSPLRWFEHKIECATCHDVHGTAGNPKFLRMDNTASKLCLHCHEK